MRITSAREQVEMLTPWHTAAPIPPVPVRKPPSRGQENPGYGHQDAVRTPEGVTGDWAARDWRNGNGGAFHSPIRPPMSSDIPHPSEMGKKAITEDPEHDPWGVLNGTGQSFENLVQNHMSHQQNMTPDQGYAGRVWYQAAHDATKDLAAKTTGHHGKAVATMSAYSPKTGWDENMEKGHHFLTHYDGSDPNFTVPGMGAHTESAKAIYHSQGDDWQQALTGPKRSAFAKNILDPTQTREPRPGVEDDAGFYPHPANPHTNEPDWRMGSDQDSTIDTHHVRMSNTPHGADLSGLEYKTPNYFGKKVKSGDTVVDPSYDLHSRAAWEATRRINAAEPDPHRHLVPKQVQAGPWTKFKADVDNAGKGANMAEPGTAPKSYDDAMARGKSEEDWAAKSPLTNPIPRYQRDRGDWWSDPRRPKEDLRTTPNWNRHSSLSPWWDHALAGWIAQHPQHPPAGIMASRVDRELLAFVDGVLAGIDLGPEFQKSVMKDVDETGGFSRRGPQKAPDKGFMVAQPGAEKIEPSPGFSGQSIADYGQQHTPAMDADPDLYQGGWNDEESGDFYHDLSKHHNDIWDAAKAGYGDNEENAQHGIYDLGTGTTFSPLELHNKWGPGYMMAGRED